MDDLRLWAPVVIALASLAVASYRLVRDTTRETVHDLQERYDRMVRESADKDDAIKALRQEILTLKDEIAALRQRIVELTAIQRRTGGGSGQRKIGPAGPGGADV